MDFEWVHGGPLRTEGSCFDLTKKSFCTKTSSRQVEAQEDQKEFRGITSSLRSRRVRSGRGGPERWTGEKEETTR